jgi:hypothetical protein
LRRVLAATMLAVVAVLTTFSSGLRGTFTILCKIAGVVRCSAAAVAPFAAFASGFHGTRAITSKIARTALAADMTGARSLLAVESEVSTIGNRFG